jgi:hypothetical protein
MSFWNSEQPLGLPSGTVRAIIVLTLTFTNCALLMKFAVFKEEMPESVFKLMMATIPTNILLIKDYIASRIKEEDAGTNSNQA